MRFQTIRLDKVGKEKGEQLPFVVIRVRGGRWARWLDNKAFPQYDAMAQQHIAVGMWDNLNDWFEVEPNYCQVCSHPQPLCSFCKEPAIYFLEWEELVTNIFLCSDCGEPYVKINEIHEQFLEELGWPELEVGLYACCDGCDCDYWQ